MFVALGSAAPGVSSKAPASVLSEPRDTTGTTARLQKLVVLASCQASGAATAEPENARPSGSTPAYENLPALTAAAVFIFSVT